MRKLRRGTWKTSTKNHKAQPHQYCFPENAKDLQKIVREAESFKKRVRAVGSGHSFSDVAIGHDYLVNIKKMNQIYRVEQKQLSPSYQDQHQNLIYAEAGITIQRLNRKLDRWDLCIKNMGAVDEQTLAGAISTGTHGTGIELPAMSGMVKAIMLVAHEGQIYRIEPSVGVVDRATYEKNHPGIILKQDDQWFHAALVNLGCFGIIYAYVIETEPMYWLAETKEVVLWAEVKKQLLSAKWRSFLSSYQIPDRPSEKKDRRWKQKWRNLGFSPAEKVPVRAMSIIVNPYQVKGQEDRTCLISRHVLLKQRPQSSRLHDLMRPLQYIIVGSFRPLSFLFYRLIRSLNRFSPRLMPIVIERTVKSLRDDIYTNKGYRVMYQGAEYIKLKAFDAEYAFDLSRKQSHVINAIEAIFAQAETFKKEGQLYQSSPIGMRFVQASQAYLTPESGRDVCYVDTPVLLGTQGADGILDAYQDIFIKYEGIPHWGKVNNRFVGRMDLLLKAYPKLWEWEKICRKLNPMGTFSNNFSDRLGLGKLGEMAQKLISGTGHRGGTQSFQQGTRAKSRVTRRLR